jgi:hypothetical protein
VQVEPVPVKPTKGDCPSCGGTPKGRGWRHADYCPERCQVKLAAKPKKAPCSDCGGPARGRGWTHLPTCAIVQARQKSPATA